MFWWRHFFVKKKKVLKYIAVSLGSGKKSFSVFFFYTYLVGC